VRYYLLVILTVKATRPQTVAAFQFSDFGGRQEVMERLAFLASGIGPYRGFGAPVWVKFIRQNQVLPAVIVILEDIAGYVFFVAALGNHNLDIQAAGVEPGGHDPRPPINDLAPLGLTINIGNVVEV